MAPYGNMKEKLDRRRFLVLSGTAGAALATPARQAGAPAEAGPPTSFPPKEASLLQALAEAILSPPEGHPRPAQVEVVRYLEQQFASPERREFLRGGLQALQEEVRLRFGRGRSFGRLPPAEQEGLLRDIQGGRVQAFAWKQVSAPRFFGELRTHLVDAYYSHPLVFQAIGYEGAAQFHGHPDYHQWPAGRHREQEQG